MALTTESQSATFPIDGVTIEQTLFSTYNPYSGLYISGSVNSHLLKSHSPSFRNTEASLNEWDEDGRPRLGLYSFIDDNLFSDNFPDIISNELFKQIPKNNLVRNGDCKSVDKVIAGYGDNDGDLAGKAIAYKPRGDWKMMNLDGVGYQISPYTSTYLLDNDDFRVRFPQNLYLTTTPYEFEPDNQNAFGHGGFLPYAPLTYAQISSSLSENRYRILDGTLSSMSDTEIDESYHTFNVYEQEFGQEGGVIYPRYPIPSYWANTGKAFSYNRCLVFHNMDYWSTNVVETWGDNLRAIGYIPTGGNLLTFIDAFFNDKLHSTEPSNLKAALPVFNDLAQPNIAPPTGTWAKIMKTGDTNSNSNKIMSSHPSTWPGTMGAYFELSTAIDATPMVAAPTNAPTTYSTRSPAGYVNCAYSWDVADKWNGFISMINFDNYNSSEGWNNIPEEYTVTFITSNAKIVQADVRPEKIRIFQSGSAERLSSKEAKSRRWVGTIPSLFGSPVFGSDWIDDALQIGKSANRLTTQDVWGGSNLTEFLKLILSTTEPFFLDWQDTEFSGLGERDHAFEGVFLAWVGSDKSRFNKNHFAWADWDDTTDEVTYIEGQREFVIVAKTRPNNDQLWPYQKDDYGGSYMDGKRDKWVYCYYQDTNGSHQSIIDGGGDGEISSIVNGTFSKAIENGEDIYKGRHFGIEVFEPNDEDVLIQELHSYPIPDSQGALTNGHAHNNYPNGWVMENADTYYWDLDAGGDKRRAARGCLPLKAYQKESHFLGEWENYYLKGNANLSPANPFIKQQLIDTYTLNEGVGEGLADRNEYRIINQCQKIYSYPEKTLNPYSSLKVRFKMRTESHLYSGLNKPQPTLNNDTEYIPKFPLVEAGVVPSYESIGFDYMDGTILGDDASTTAQYNLPQMLKPAGSFNSQNYTDDDNSGESKYSRLGSMARFKNTKLDEWETFEFNFNLTNEFLFNLDPDTVRDLYFFIQPSSDNVGSNEIRTDNLNQFDDVGKWRGRVYLDNFEVIESYDFQPDVDVRKKISVGNYGKGVLTKYYDPNIEEQVEAYKDTTAPLEAQFYFYPQYPTEDIFLRKRTPIYNDFKNGMFYIYDINWGDGSPNEFTSEPEKIDENNALYHTYERAGIFEVTGYMIRMKPDENYEPIGIAHTKKFSLKINVNEDRDEDFEYFGGDGFSFIPYKNTLPIVGGYSKESAYYKGIKRQLGILSDSVFTTTKFDSDGDRLRTELALNKMDESYDGHLNILNEFKKQRTELEPSVNFPALLGTNGYLLQNYTYKELYEAYTHATLVYPENMRDEALGTFTDGFPNLNGNLLTYGLGSYNDFDVDYWWADVHTVHEYYRVSNVRGLSEQSTAMLASTHYFMTDFTHGQFGSDAANTDVRPLQYDWINSSGYDYNDFVQPTGEYYSKEFFGWKLENQQEALFGGPAYGDDSDTDLCSWSQIPEGMSAGSFPSSFEYDDIPHYIDEEDYEGYPANPNTGTELPGFEAFVPGGNVGEEQSQDTVFNKFLFNISGGGIGIISTWSDLPTPWDDVVFRMLTFLNDTQNGTGGGWISQDIEAQQSDDSGLAYTGIETFPQQLGKSIGDVDLTNVKYYNKPKHISELLGFKDDKYTLIGTNTETEEQNLGNKNTYQWVSADLNVNSNTIPSELYKIVNTPITLPDGTNVGGGTATVKLPNGEWSGNQTLQTGFYYTFFSNSDIEWNVKPAASIPNNKRYWKNIIPKNYSIFNRDGIGLVNQPISFPKFNEVMNVTYQEELFNGDTNVLTGRLEELLNPMGVNMTGFQLDESLRPKGYIEMVITTENPTQGWVPDEFVFANWQSFLTENPSGDDLYRIRWHNYDIPPNVGEGFPKNKIMINSGNGWKVGRNTIRLYFDDAYYIGPGSSFEDSPSTGWINWNIEDGINFTIVQMNIERNISVIPEENWINNQIVNQIIVEDIKIVPTQTINTYKEQDWLDLNQDNEPDYYYPVLPKYNSNGRFIAQTYPTGSEGLPHSGLKKIPFPGNPFDEQSSTPPITNESQTEDNLVINIGTEKLDNNVYSDNSGNNNAGFVISDYKNKFDNQTLKPDKKKRFDRLINTKTDGAF